MTLRNRIKKLPFARPVYRWFAHELPFLFRRNPVMTIQGSKMHLDVHDEDAAMRRTFRAYAKAGIHEPRTTAFLTATLKPGDTFIDLGANIGYFSLLAARCVGASGRVFSFEPEPRNFRCLARNRELNRYSQMTIENKAVSNTDDRLKLYICPYDTGHHTLRQKNGITAYEAAAEYDSESISFVEIDAVTLDHYLASRNCLTVDVIKMDVEGAELCALEGMERTIRSNGHLQLLFEFFPLLIEKMGRSPRDLLLKLTKDFQFCLREIPEDYHAGKSDTPAVLRDLSIDELLANYAGDTMYHINILAARSAHTPSVH